MNIKIVIDYTNHRGERSMRTVIPFGFRFGTSPFHPEPQWLMEAFDRDKGETRTFALLGILGIEPDLSREGTSP